MYTYANRSESVIIINLTMMDCDGATITDSLAIVLRAEKTKIQ